MFLRPLDCPKCGAPLPPESIGASCTTCPFCDATLAAERNVVWAAAYRRALAELDRAARVSPLVQVGDVPYVLEGRLARGARCDVLLARRARTPSERVVIKALRDGAPESISHEHRVLELLHASDAPGAAHFTTRLPQVVARGALRAKGEPERPALVVRFASGFVHTLRDVRQAHGDALDPRHAIWIARRALELLGFVHASGVAHGAIEARHMLLHARDHGVLVVGWSRATIGCDRALREGDVSATARAIVELLGGDPRTGRSPARVPGPIAAVLHARVTSPSGDAWALERALSAAAREVFGPPAYVTLSMPS